MQAKTDRYVLPVVVIMVIIPVIAVLLLGKRPADGDMVLAG